MEEINHWIVVLGKLRYKNYGTINNKETLNYTCEKYFACSIILYNAETWILQKKEEK